MRKCIILFLLISLFNILSSCSDLGFYWQATKGHLSLLNKKKNIQDLIDAPDTPAELKRKLKLVESTKSFANQYLTISLNEAYTGYVELERSYVTLVVTAAKPLELKSYQWCYLFIGCQEYRGFFIESEAKLFASKMISENLDVSIRPVTAYSTLGWLNKPWLPDYFSDPVLSSFLRRHDADLISTLFHVTLHFTLDCAGPLLSSSRGVWRWPGMFLATAESICEVSDQVSDSSRASAHQKDRGGVAARVQFVWPNMRAIGV